MKFLFVNIGIEPTYPVAIGALSAYIKREGHESRLLDLINPEPDVTPKNMAALQQILAEYQPEGVGFTVFETGFHWITQICQEVKKHNPQILTVAGGYYPILQPERVVENPHIDVACVGEGERPLAALLSRFEKGEDYTQIESLWVKKDGQLFKNCVGPLIEDLDSLPHWDRDMFDYQAHLDLSPVGDRNVKVMASRGCPFKCTYCSNNFFKEIYPNKTKYLRMRSVDDVIAELVTLKESYEFEYVGFHDDNLSLKKSWLHEFAPKYKTQVGKKFYCAARPETCTDEILDLLKEAGCFMVLIGLESGDEEYRKVKMQRKMSNEAILEASRKIKERGMLIWTFNMVGLPGETRNQVWKTILLNWRIGPDFAMTSVYYPLRGTAMGNMCYDEGLVDLEKQKRVSTYAFESVIINKNLTRFDIKFAKYATIFSALRSKNGFFLNEVKIKARNKIRQSLPFFLKQTTT